MSEPRFTLLIDGGRMARFSGLSAAQAEALVATARQHPAVRDSEPPAKIEVKREEQR